MWSFGCVVGELCLRAPLFPGNNYLDQWRLIGRGVGPRAEAPVRLRLQTALAAGAPGAGVPGVAVPFASAFGPLCSDPGLTAAPAAAAPAVKAGRGGEPRASESRAGRVLLESLVMGCLALDPSDR